MTERSVAILAPGESLPGLIASIPPGTPKIAVNNAYRLAPDSVALVAADVAWWMHEQPALEGRRFCAYKHAGTEQVVDHRNIIRGLNSGALAMIVAAQMGYARLLLYGFDGRGGHFHGPHPAPLKNPDNDQFRRQNEQFRRLHLPGVEVINCTPGSRIGRWPAKEAPCT